MKQSYCDITNKLGKPLWWDEVGAPRYDEFSPDLLNDIYAKEAALMLIKCQVCRTEFKVCLSSWEIDKKSISDRILNNSLYYGDPPDFGCCCSGPTMTSDPVRVLEFWKRENFEWVRMPELEREFNN